MQGNQSLGRAKVIAPCREPFQRYASEKFALAALIQFIAQRIRGSCAGQSLADIAVRYAAGGPAAVHLLALPTFRNGIGAPA